MKSVLSTSFDDIRSVYDSEVPETIENSLSTINSEKLLNRSSSR